MSRTPLANGWFRTSVVLGASLLLLLPAASGALAQYKEQIVTGIVIDPPPKSATEAAVRGFIRHEVGQPYDVKKAQEDLDTIITTLGVFSGDQSLSYVDTAPAGDRNGILLIYHLTENPQVTAIVVKGNVLVSSEELVEAIAPWIPVGKTFDAGGPANDKISQAVEKCYAEKGYSAGLLSAPSLDPETGEVSIQIVEDYVYDIEIDLQSSDGGSPKTKRRVVEREITTKIGDPLSANQVQRDLNRLHNLDIFESIVPSLREGPEFGDKILVISCVERKTGTFNLGVGFSDREGIIGFGEISERNLMGMGRRLSARVELGQVHLYDITYVEPWLSGDHTSLEASIYDRTTRQDRTPLGTTGSSTGYLSTESRQGGNITISKPINDAETNWISARYRYERIVNEDPRLVSVISPSLRRGTVGSLMVRWTDDSRNLAFDPTEGSRFDVSVEHANRWLGGDSVFTRFDVEARKFIEVGSEGVIALRAAYGTILGNAPIFDTYAVGGAESLRGYREDRFFGTRRALMQVEFRKYLGGGDDKKDVQAVAFVDLGDAWGGQWRASDGTIYSAEHRSFSPQIGYGVGVRVSTALGPIRLDYGFGREGGRYHFGLYQTF